MDSDSNSDNGSDQEIIVDDTTEPIKANFIYPRFRIIRGEDIRVETIQFTPKSLMTIRVEGTGSSSMTNVTMIDHMGQIRYKSSNGGEIHEYITRLQNTRSYGRWKLLIDGIMKDESRTFEIEIPFFVVKEIDDSLDEPIYQPETIIEEEEEDDEIDEDQLVVEEDDGDIIEDPTDSSLLDEVLKDELKETRVKPTELKIKKAKKAENSTDEMKGSFDPVHNDKETIQEAIDEVSTQVRQNAENIEDLEVEEDTSDSLYEEDIKVNTVEEALEEDKTRQEIEKQDQEDTKSHEMLSEVSSSKKEGDNGTSHKLKIKESSNQTENSRNQTQETTHSYIEDTNMSEATSENSIQDYDVDNPDDIEEDKGQYQDSDLGKNMSTGSLNSVANGTRDTNTTDSDETNQKLESSNLSSMNKEKESNNFETNPGLENESVLKENIDNKDGSDEDTDKSNQRNNNLGSISLPVPSIKTESKKAEKKEDIDHNSENEIQYDSENSLDTRNYMEEMLKEVGSTKLEKIKELFIPLDEINIIDDTTLNLLNSQNIKYVEEFLSAKRSIVTKITQYSQAKLDEIITRIQEIITNDKDPIYLKYSRYGEIEDNSLYFSTIPPTEINGIGPKTFEKLKQIEIDNVTDFANADVKTIAEATGFSVRKVCEFKTEAIAIVYKRVNFIDHGFEEYYEEKLGNIPSTAQLDLISGIDPIILNELYGIGISNLEKMANADLRKLSTAVGKTVFEIIPWIFEAQIMYRNRISIQFRYS